MSPLKQIFLSYSSDDGFEAELLQYALEQLLVDFGVVVWTYQRNQGGDERSIGAGLKQRVREAIAAIFLVSPSTFKSGATQWMELAYADAYDVPTFVILHKLTFVELRSRRRGVPPLLLEGQCNPSSDWKRIVETLRSLLSSDAVAPSRPDGSGVN